MSLLNNNKGKDKKKGSAPASSKFINTKVKTNTKAVTRNTKLTGGAQRGT